MQNNLKHATTNTTILLHMKTPKKRILFLVISFVLSVLQLQALTHPITWVSEADKAAILDNISKYEWAATLKNDLKSRVDNAKNAHKTNPASILNEIPPIPGSRSGHCDILDIAVESGILYFLYNDTDYAQISADILNFYVEKLGVADWNDCIFLNEDSEYFIGSRTVYTRFAIAYDFVFNFVKDPQTTVYDLATGNRETFNHAKAQQTCKNLANRVLKIGGLGSNHSLLEGCGALYNIICIDDDATREEFFSRFWNGDTRHDAFNGYSLKKFSAEDGLWPESMSYSKGPQNDVIRMMEVIDRFKPELNVVQSNLRVLEGAFLFEDFKYPNQIEIAAYGDARRNGVETEYIYRNILATATRKNLSHLEEEASTSLKQTYRLTGYHPRITSDYLDWSEPLKLLWGVNFDLSGDIEPYKYNTTAKGIHAGVVLQRNYNCVDAENNGLVYYTGGAHYVHSHLSGLDMELYGAGYVMGGVGADMPNPDDRSLDINRNYYRIYAGHNTVIVNGKSVGRGSGSWKSDGILWQNTTELVSSEPKPLEDPIANNFCFSTQRLEDRVNNCDQQRTVSIIRTSPTTGYYLDIFRSKSLETNNFHDYVYHNIGDELSMTDSTGTAIETSAAPTRYTSFDVTYNSAVIKFPGWHYFESVQTSPATAKSVQTHIKLNTFPNKYMHITSPGGVSREYSSAEAPPILEAAAGYNKINARVLTVRQYGEAWNKPFINVFEPSTNSASSIQSVEQLMDGDKTVGALVKSTISDIQITDYIVAQDQANATYSIPSENFTFNGRFGILRKEVQGDNERINMYIGEGTTLTYGDTTLTANAKKQGFKSYGEIDSIVIKPDATIEIEAEDYDEGGEGVAYHDFDAGNSGGAYRTDDVDIIASTTASNGFAISNFKGADWMKYTFHVEEAGYYAMNYFAANRNRDDAIADITIDTTLVFGDVLIARTLDWEVYANTLMPNLVYLTKGSHTLIVKQKRSLSHNPDKFVFTKQTSTQIKENTQNLKTSVFPNPSQSMFTIRSKEALMGTFAIYTMDGKLIQKGIMNGQETMQFQIQKQGTYLLRMQTKKGK